MANSPYSDLDIEQVIAVDFGSYGFAASYGLPGKPETVRIVENWSEAQAASELNKNLTALLIDRKTKETVAIGYEAEEKYAKAVERKEDDQFLYFQHFKPFLYSTDHLKKNKEVEAAGGNGSLSLAELITLSFSAVMQHSLGCINDMMAKLKGMRQVTPGNAFWVLSVPAIWDEMSKEMMKSCARRAGMRHFALGSEPICTVFHVLQKCEVKLSQRANSKTKFVVLDCGGGTVDASCVEVSADKQGISELHFGEGLFCGGLAIDDKFNALLKQMLPRPLLHKVRKGDWVRQRHIFVASKFTLPLQFDEFSECWNVEFAYSIKQQLSKLYKKRKKVFWFF